MSGLNNNLKRRISRRRALMTAAAMVSVPQLGSAAVVSDRHLRIESIEQTTVRLPMRPVPERNMAREIPHWKYFELFEVKLSNDVVGIGETMLYYTWRGTESEDVERVKGKNAVECMWDDTLGAGLQMALFDAVAKSAGVPVYRLLGDQVHERTPLSWWNIDTSAEDMVSDCKEALRQGYMSYKTKGRPWFDVHRQVKMATAAVPESFKIDMDFNDTLLDAERAIPILKDLEKYPQVDIYETPIPQEDIEGNCRIRDATRVAIAMHYGNPNPAVVIRREACDGFVVGGGAREVMDAAAVAAVADMPFWLQLVGSSLTAHFSLHFGAVCSHATWPAVNCHQLFSAQIVNRVPEVKGGTAAIPQQPGIGVQLDRDAIEKFRVPKPASRPEPKRLIETAWPDGQKAYIANDGEVNFVLTAGQKGKYPFYKKGAETRLVPEDGSKWWKEMYRRARNGLVLE
ncbi:MAG TPA: dgoA protein [Planctomycetaceae bacterium]|nr:dgoA protein [Planctomycetaceae bacterium]